MTDTNQPYLLLAKHLNRTRQNLTEVCAEFHIDRLAVDDDILEQHVQECCNCGIWGTSHKRDLDNFPICTLCYRLVGA